jgi:hypothetical protein
VFSAFLLVEQCVAQKTNIIGPSNPKSAVLTVLPSMSFNWTEVTFFSGSTCAQEKTEMIDTSISRNILRMIF